MPRRAMVAGLLLAWPLAIRGQTADAGRREPSAPRPAEAFISGRIVNDRTDQPLAEVEVRLRGEASMVRSDSLGAFRIASPVGRRILELRKPGWRPFAAEVVAASGASVEYVLGLEPAPATLSTVTVAASAADRRLAQFDAHRIAGLGGHFLSTARFTEAVGQSLADVLASVAGADIVRGRGGAAFYATRRGYDTIRGMLKISPADRARGAAAGTCYAAVLVNGLFVYRGDDGEVLYDLNQLAPADVLGVEIYNGGATMPLEYNGTRSTCGLVAIWTR